MLTCEQVDQFRRDGYILVPNMLTAEQVKSLRAALRPKFDLPPDRWHPGDLGCLLFDVYSRHPEIRWLLFHEPTIKVLRSLLGEDFVVLREASVHFNQYNSGWHKDTIAQETAGHTFHWQDDYLMVEVAYYLQDNSKEFGGGLDVEPGSHRIQGSVAVSDGKTGLARAIWNTIFPGKERRITKYISIPSTAGDLVIFDFRVNHRGTPTRRADHPEERKKIALFLACSRNNAHVRAYHDFIGSRPDYVYLQNFSYPEDLLSEARRVGLTLA